MPKTNEIGDYRLYGEIALQSMVWRRYLGVRLSWMDEYESRPQPGVKPNDALWMASLTVHFGE